MTHPGHSVLEKFNSLLNSLGTIQYLSELGVRSLGSWVNGEMVDTGFREIKFWNSSRN
jgi:hypothetical protein